MSSNSWFRVGLLFLEVWEEGDLYFVAHSTDLHPACPGCSRAGEGSPALGRVENLWLLGYDEGGGHTYCSGSVQQKTFLSRNLSTWGLWESGRWELNKDDSYCSPRIRKRCTGPQSWMVLELRFELPGEAKVSNRGRLRIRKIKGWWL